MSQAYNVLLEKVYKPTLLTKLAEVYGIVPRNKVEEDNLIQLAFSLRSIDHNYQSIKQAADDTSNSLIVQASDALKKLYPYLTSEPHPFPTSLDEFLEKTAETALLDPTILSAAIAYATQDQS